jgi:alpha/beta superfamily hydrolase
VIERQRRPAARRRPARRGGRPVARAIACLALLAAVLAACTEHGDPPPSGSKAVSVRTPDGITLNVIVAGTGADVVVLSHGATGTKEDFYGLATAFVRDGWRALAYDARGVGDSTGDVDFAKRDVDLRAVVEYARRTGAERIVLAGGSLGAALSISMAQDLKADVVVSLSAPQTSYDAIDAARRIGDSIPAFVAAAADNEPYADDARTLAAALGVHAVIVSGQGHGTGMLRDHPELKARIVRFADEAIGRNG